LGIHEVFDKLLKSARKSSHKWANRKNEEGGKTAYKEEGEVEKAGRTLRREQRNKMNEKLTMIPQKARRMEPPNFQSSKPPLCIALRTLRIFAAAVVDEETIMMPGR
jgi:hypothetical protein